MTREEAIQILADLIDSPFLHTWEKQNKALHMAIEALSAEHKHCWNCKHYEPRYNVCHAPEVVKQVTSKLKNPCDSLLTDDNDNSKEQKSKLDLISRADAIEAVHRYFVEEFNNEPYETDEDGDEVFTDMKSVNKLLAHNKAVSKALKALPSAEAEPTMTEEVREALMRLTMCAREECGMCKYKDECGFDFQYNISTENMHTILEALSAEADVYEDYEHATLVDIKEPLKASAEAVQGWIPCNKQMPDELDAVNVTWVNHLAPPYYKHIEDVPFVDSAVYYRGKWYWWDATVIDVLAEYGEDCNAEQIDKDIEILAWMPLPEPYREDGEA